MTPTPETNTPSGGFWSAVAADFRRRRGAMAGLCFVVALFVLAGLAPALASRYPFFWKSGDTLTFPWFRQFFAPFQAPEQALERGFSFITLFTLLALPALRLTRGTRPRIRGVLLGALAVACLLPFLLVQSRNDMTPYRSMHAEGEGSGFFAPVPYGPFEKGFGVRRPPTWCDDASASAEGWHLLGTDMVGRDVLARVIHGARVSLTVGVFSVLIATSLGLLFGATAGYFGGYVDMAISRLIELVICFPSFFLILTIIALVDQRSILNIVLVIGLTGWTGIARLTRGQVLSERGRDYVTAARALGARSNRIIFRHILPNAVAPVLVAMTFGIAGSILTESGLSFLGFGVDMPTASWGELLAQARHAPQRFWWLAVFPGFAIFATVTIYNLVGEGLRDAMDPRLRGGR